MRYHIGEKETVFPENAHTRFYTYDEGTKWPMAEFEKYMGIWETYLLKTYNIRTEGSYRGNSSLTIGAKKTTAVAVKFYCQKLQEMVSTDPTASKYNLVTIKTKDGKSSSAPIDLLINKIGKTLLGHTIIRDNQCQTINFPADSITTEALLNFLYTTEDPFKRNGIDPYDLFGLARLYNLKDLIESRKSVVSEKSAGL